MVERSYEITAVEHAPSDSMCCLQVDQTHLVGWFIKGEEYYGAYWKPKGTVKELVSNARILSSVLVTNGIKPKPDILNNKIQYFVDPSVGIQTANVNEIDRLEDLGDERLNFVRLYTPYADFSLERLKKGEEFNAAFVTHVYSPDEIAEFIRQNSSEDIPLDKIKELLDLVQAAKLSEGTAEVNG